MLEGILCAADLILEGTRFVSMMGNFVSRNTQHVQRQTDGDDK